MKNKWVWLFGFLFLNIQYMHGMQFNFNMPSSQILGVQLPAASATACVVAQPLPRI